MNIEKKVFEQSDRGFRIQAWYLKDSSDALIRIDLNDKKLREFTFPAYKVWNLAAHFSDIVDGELAKSAKGYEAAASDGLGGHVQYKSI